MSSFGPHVASGIITGVMGIFGIFATNCQVEYMPLYALPFICGVTGALTPDMDIKSKSSQCMYILYTGFALYLYYIDKLDLAFYTLLYAIIPQFFGHRGFIHSFIFGLLSAIGLFIICYYNTSNTLFSLISSGTYLIGFIMHLALDNI